MENTHKNLPTEGEVANGKVKETTNPQTLNIAGEKETKIKRAKVDSLIIYEVTEGELETIERGSPNSIYLNFAIALLSTTIAFIITLFTCDFVDKDKTYYTFLIICILFGICGLLLFVIWLCTKNDVNEALKKIRDRPLS